MDHSDTRNLKIKKWTIEKSFLQKDVNDLKVFSGNKAYPLASRKQNIWRGERNSPVNDPCIQHGECYHGCHTEIRYLLAQGNEGSILIYSPKPHKPILFTRNTLNNPNLGNALQNLLQELLITIKIVRGKESGKMQQPRGY